MQKLVIGILAHVDAGKTTLAESMLYRTGSIRSLGRVDHQNAYLDNDQLERARGITIFSKQAEMVYHDLSITLLDTPGHVDFSAEMERTLQVLDYAILVISGSDGVQGHTETLWRLLARHKIPAFIFVNKMDLGRRNQETLMRELKDTLNDGCCSFNEMFYSKEFQENVALYDEVLLNKYLEGDKIEKEDIPQLVRKRKIFPCYFGSALKIEGVEELLSGIYQFSQRKMYPEVFGGKVYKVSRDENGTRLTFMKITGGNLRVKSVLSNQGLIHNHSLQLEDWEEKVDQIRVYSGSKYEVKEEVEAGMICAVTGLTKTVPGMGFGVESGSEAPILEPVLRYQVVVPSECDAFTMLSKLKILEEEDPQMKFIWSDRLKEIHVMLMGEIQLEILKYMILERFQVNVEFSLGSIVYKETITKPIIGVGHFEPLRHYAEVHLLMEPNEPGSGISVDTNCSEELLDRNLQRLVLTHLEEREHVGVLTGSPVTDIKITLIAGRSHQKHTEGGDFRQATYRGVRQGLKKANSILLEPYYNYRLEIPTEMVGRAMTDIMRMSGEFHLSDHNDGITVITGSAPVATMRGYQSEVNSYTKGRGRISITFGGYLPCHNQEEVIEQFGYDSERDLENPTGSVFCKHGAGFPVAWNEVEEYMHISDGLKCNEEPTPPSRERVVKPRNANQDSWQQDKELEEIFIRTFGPMKQSRNVFDSSRSQVKKNESENAKQSVKIELQQQRKEEYLLVDGYNIIYAWDELKELAMENLEGARTKLIDILCNYQGYKQCNLILVFDAYQVKGSIGNIQAYHNIHVVYTKEAETADQYIEKATHTIAKKHQVTVATSDALEQMIIMGQGAIRLSANDLKEEINRTNIMIREKYRENTIGSRAYLKDQMKEIDLG